MSSPTTTLKTKLAITPKTASLLLQAGYTDYRELCSVSPNHVVQQFKDLPGVTASQAETYRRGLRRMVWLATQDEPEEQAKRYPDWTQKALKARGIWSDDFDSLSGEQIEALIRDCSDKEE
jgi:hypothetical protein